MLSKNYTKFLYFLDCDLEKIFKNQEEYICCKDGCSYCCEDGEYPFSMLEYEYLMKGFDSLDINTQKKINENISNVKKNGKASYKCPFLIDKRCSVYKYRGIICRTFGVLSEKANGNLAVPFCYSLGLNYSKVYDEKTQKISLDMIMKNNYKTFPHPFNLRLSNIINMDITKELELDFGEIKRLIDWF